MSYRIEIFGRAAPKGSMIAAKTKAGKPYTYPASKYERPWINAVRDATRNVMRHHEMLAPPYAIELTFRLHARDHPQDWPTGADLDKLARAFIDGLVKGGAIADDRHVIELHLHKEWAQAQETAGAAAYIWRATTVEQRAA